MKRRSLLKLLGIVPFTPNIITHTEPIRQDDPIDLTYPVEISNSRRTIGRGLEWHAEISREPVTLNERPIDPKYTPWYRESWKVICREVVINEKEFPSLGRVLNLNLIDVDNHKIIYGKGMCTSWTKGCVEGVFEELVFEGTGPLVKVEVS